VVATGITRRAIWGSRHPLERAQAGGHLDLLIEKTRRPAHGFPDFHHHRLRILLVADGSRPYRGPPNHA
jgi:hypothetical protein